MSESMPVALLMQNIPPGGDKHANPGHTGNHSGWEREMERQQAATWFKGAVADQSGARAHQRAAPVSMADNASISSAQAIRLAINYGLSGSENAGSRMEQQQSRPVVSGIEANTRPQLTESLEELADAGRKQEVLADMALKTEIRPGVNGSLIKEAETEQLFLEIKNMLEETFAFADFPQSDRHSGVTVKRAPIRLHVQFSEEKLQLWVGIDGDTENLRRTVFQLAEQLQRWLEKRGLALQSLVCNGRVVFGAVSSGLPSQGNSHTPLEKSDSQHPVRLDSALHENEDTS